MPTVVVRVSPEVVVLGAVVGVLDGPEKKKNHAPTPKSNAVATVTIVPVFLVKGMLFYWL